MWSLLHSPSRSAASQPRLYVMESGWLSACHGGSEPVSIIIQQTGLSLFAGSCGRFLKAARENRPLCENILNPRFTTFYKFLLDKADFINWNMLSCPVSVCWMPDSPVLQNVTLFGTTVSTDEPLERQSCWSRVDLRPHMTGVFTEWGHLKTYMCSGRQCVQTGFLKYGPRKLPKLIAET